MTIGITGKIGSGKDTAAEIIRELHPEMNFQVKKFAKKLKTIASMLTGIVETDFERQSVKDSRLGDEWGGMTIREFLQKIGTEAIRNGLHRNTWVNALFCGFHKENQGIWLDFMGLPTSVEAHAWNYAGDAWIITDVRFPNEHEAIQGRGGMCIRIVRPDNPYPQSNHQSETALDDVELLTIINDGNTEQLRIRVQEIFDPIVSRFRASYFGVSEHVPNRP